ncbi:hypothetical protein E4U58_000284 [Claviceps cyperi]|nr:hypothetical protein E4U58_000284 [Claviceps cyperi]
MPNQPRPTRESLTVSIDEIDQGLDERLDHAFYEMYIDLEEDWYTILELEYGDTLPVVEGYDMMPTLIALSEACKRREAIDGAFPELTLHDEIGYGMSAGWLYQENEPELLEARTKILVILDSFWTKILKHPRRHEPLTMTPFDMARRLLERQKQMAEAGEGRMAQIDRLLDLLLQEELVGLFPMVLTKEQWVQLFLADFELEDCKILYILEMEYFFVVQLPVYRAA